MIAGTLPQYVVVSYLIPVWIFTTWETHVIKAKRFDQQLLAFKLYMTQESIILVMG